MHRALQPPGRPRRASPSWGALGGLLSCLAALSSGCSRPTIPLAPSPSETSAALANWHFLTAAAPYAKLFEEGHTWHFELAPQATAAPSDLAPAHSAGEADQPGATPDEAAPGEEPGPLTISAAEDPQSGALPTAAPGDTRSEELPDTGGTQSELLPTAPGAAPSGALSSASPPAGSAGAAPDVAAGPPGEVPNPPKNGTLTRVSCTVTSVERRVNAILSHIECDPSLPESPLQGAWGADARGLFRLERLPEPGSPALVSEHELVLPALPTALNVELTPPAPGWFQSLEVAPMLLQPSTAETPAAWCATQRWWGAELGARQLCFGGGDLIEATTDDGEGLRVWLPTSP